MCGVTPSARIAHLGMPQARGRSDRRDSDSSSAEAPTAAEAPAPPPAITPTDSLLLRRLGDSSALSSGALTLAGSRLVFFSRRRRPFSSPRGVESGSEASGGVLRPLGGGVSGGRLEDLDRETWAPG